MLVFVALTLFAGLSARDGAAQDTAEASTDGQAAETPAQADAQAAADLELISALERVVSRAIARAERSVVSIARRRRPPAAQAQSDYHYGRGTLDAANPWDPNFIPNEFATGVVIDSSGLVLTNN
ncbi:MAG TPA: hypothetical protein VG125_18050, partial [Pirellulales bacterium]|nr:hypothetical protein [Pirellulales bacterium]